MKDVHGKGIVHRDLKPSNCILNKYDDKSIKIVDFGLARLIQAEFIPPGICACDFDRVCMYVYTYVYTYIYMYKWPFAAPHPCHDFAQFWTPL